MPPPPSGNTPPHPNPLANESNTVLPDASAQQNTRALLRSLEELRDSLSTRVEQLSNAVERLRGQAGELERALEGERGNPVVAGMEGGATPTPREPRDPTRSRQRARDIVNAFENRENPSPVPNPSSVLGITPAPALNPSPISRSLSRPITRDEIHTLLDRASASISTSASRPSQISITRPTGTNENTDPWLTRAQNIENRIQRLNETARELRSRANQPSNIGNAAAAVAANGNENTNANAQPSDILRGLLTRAVEVREDQARLEDNIRQLEGIRSELRTAGNQRTDTTNPALNSEARTPQIVHAVPMSRGERSHQGSRGTISSASRSRGLQPTNIRQVMRQPAPQIVRSSPTSPSSTISSSVYPLCPNPPATSTTPATHIAVSSGNGNGSEVPSEDGNQALTSSRSPSAETNPNSTTLVTVITAEEMRDMWPETAQERHSNTASESPIPPPRSNLPPPPTTTNRRHNPNNANGDDSLTFRGRRVVAQMGDRAPTSNNSNGNEEMSGADVLRTWPFISEFLPTPPLPPTIPNPRTNNAVPVRRTPVPRRQIQERASEILSEETLNLVRQIVDRRTGSTNRGNGDGDGDSTQTRNGSERPRIRSNNLGENFRSAFRNLGNDGNNPRTSRETGASDYMSALSRATEEIYSAIRAEVEEEEDNDDPEIEFVEEYSVSVIDMTTDPPTTQRLPRFIAPHRRSTAERERIREDRLVANERISRARETLENLSLNRNNNQASGGGTEVLASGPITRAHLAERRRRDRIAHRESMRLARNGTNDNANGHGTAVAGLAPGSGLGLTPGLGLNLEIDMIEPPNVITPTQGISMADLEDGMEGVMRALVINDDNDNEHEDDDDDEDESSDGTSTGSGSGSESGSGEGTIFEGEGERIESRRAQNNRPTDAVSTATAIIEQRIPPREPFAVDLHLWPTHFTLAGL